VSAGTAGQRAILPDASVHLDAIRGLAALAVFLSHSRGVFLKSGLRDALTGSHEGPDIPAAGTSIFHNHFQLSTLLAGHQSIGRFAVIIFFVLSGYFVGGSVIRNQRRNRFSWSGYLIHRITRLWVVLIPALLLTLFLDFGGLHLFASPQNIYHQPSSPYGTALDQRLTLGAFWGNVFFLQGIAGPVFGTNEPLWSLSYEFWYYLLFPLLLTAFLRSKKPLVRFASGAAFCTLLVWCGWSIAVYFAIWGCGVIAALSPLKLSERTARIAIPLTGLALLGAMLMVLKMHTYRVVGDLILAVVFTTMLWAVLHMQRATVDGIYRHLAQGLSRMSYTLYLVHLPLLIFISSVLYPVWVPRPPSVVSFGTVIAVDVTVFGFAWLMYFCFERNTSRVRRLIEKRRGKSGAEATLSASPSVAREYS
jgi:peptidoglycan/LPS O-acetylase OafA/YrhL